MILPFTILRCLEGILEPTKDEVLAEYKKIASTGFDQPLLVAMYVDKRLSGVAAVQTLSRLNRVAPSKYQTFVLDFANTAEDIAEAFKPYYEATTLADVTDPAIVHQTMNKLDAAGIYQEPEVEGLVADYLAKKNNNALTKWVTPARDRFRDRAHNAQETSDLAALEELVVFRKDVGNFLRKYDFLSQIVNYEDTSLEKLSIYLRHLDPVITADQLQHEIDLSTVDLDYLAQHEQGTTSGKLAGGIPLEPAEEAGTGTVKDSELVALEDVIEQINDLIRRRPPRFQREQRRNPHQRPPRRKRHPAAAGAKQHAGPVLRQSRTAELVRRRGNWGNGLPQ